MSDMEGYGEFSPREFAEFGEGMGGYLWKVARQVDRFSSWKMSGEGFCSTVPIYLE